MQDVADAAGVSKGLIHYHFHDKETLLTRLIEWMTHESVDREAATLARSTPKTAVDDLWTWVAGEIDRGHLRVLNELAQERGPLISDAIRRSAQARREAAMVTVDRLFALLELRPRVPVQLLADVIVAFIEWSRDPRLDRSAGQSSCRVRRALAFSPQSRRMNRGMS